MSVGNFATRRRLAPLFGGLESYATHGVAVGVEMRAWLEREAWTAGQYLGEFTLSLVIHNVRRLAHLAETILVAIL